MPSSPKILRGLDIKGWKVCYPRFEGNAALQDITNDEQVSPSAHEENAPQGREEEILQSTRDEVEKLRQQALEQAAKEIDAFKEKAWEEGYAEGYKKGEQQAEELKSKAQETLEQARRERLQILAGAEPEIIQLAVSLAQKLLNYQLEFNDEIVLSLIAKGLESLTQEEEVVLNVNPGDEEICRAGALISRGCSRTVPSWKSRLTLKFRAAAARWSPVIPRWIFFHTRSLRSWLESCWSWPVMPGRILLARLKKQLHST